MAKSKPENTGQPTTEEKPLKAKEITFVENYIKNGEKGGPAILETEGYKAKDIYSASVIANRLLKKVKIQALIGHRKAELQAKLQEKTEISRTELVGKYEKTLELAWEGKQLSAANGAIAGQAKLLGYDTPERGGSDIGTVNIIIFGGPEQMQRLESKTKVIESSEVVEPAED